jgi:hypothetical protein
MEIKQEANNSITTLLVNEAELLLLRDALAGAICYGPGGDDKEHARIDDDSNALWHAEAAYRAIKAAAVKAIVDYGYSDEMANMSAAEYYRHVALTDARNTGASTVRQDCRGVNSLKVVGGDG